MSELVFKSAWVEKKHPSRTQMSIAKTLTRHSRPKKTRRPRVTDDLRQVYRMEISPDSLVRRGSEPST